MRSNPFDPDHPAVSGPAIAPRPLSHLRRAGTIIALVAISTASGRAQVAPDAHWRTITTPHFRVSFSDSLESTARRAAGSAERAYAGLAKELAAPRGTIDLVVADNYDTSNGYATPFPSNRIVIYARPTVDANSLKFIDDWVDLVVTHELTHIFHLDRTRGLWRLGQWVFGRNPFLFPNTYSPSWLSEAIAVHYESKLTGAGRALGTDFGAIVRAHENAGDVPGLYELSGATPLHPLGNLAYTYGSQLLERALSHGGPNAMREFVDVSAGRIIPFMLNTNATRAFGLSFDSVYAEWSDSTHREAQRVLRRVVPPRTLVSNGWFSVRPRWVDENTLVYAGADPKSVPSLREVAVGAAGDTARRTPRVVGTRNTNDATTPLPDGWRVFAQQEYTDPYSQRSDLWAEHDGAQYRLTRGARLTHPDAVVCNGGVVANQTPPGTPTFCVVAVQLLPGTARLVHVRTSATGNDLAIEPLTEASSADLYSEPRWSHDRTRIVANHWMRGGIAELTIFDRSGKVIRSLGRSRAVMGSPAWGVGDTTIFFTSDRSGRSALYRAHVNTGALARIADSPTGLFDNEPSPDGTRLATFVLGANGLDLAVVPATPTAPARATPADSTSVLPPSRGTPVATSDAPAGRYSAWRTVLPRYWEPLVEQGYRNETRYGLTLSGSDVVDRHSWVLNATQDFTLNEPEGDFAYSFAGFGMPVIGIGASQVWDHPGVPDSARKVLLPIARRKQFADLSATFARRRFRSSFSLTVGGAYEWRDFRALADYPFSRFSPADRVTLGKRFTYPSLFVGAGFSNARQPYLALGPENGFSASVTLRQRWRSDDAGATRANSAVVSVTGYRAFDFGGRIHHLLAARVAVARADLTSATDFTAGGNSGGAIQLAPGVTIGDGRRTFFVRGFEGGVLAGSDAMGTNVEYRFPIALPAHGLWKFPVYFQRISGALFSDAATAWCPAASATSPICFKPTVQEWIGSAGAELHFDTALQYDSPIRFRLGVAVPTQGRKYFGSSGVAGYFTVGLPF